LRLTQLVAANCRRYGGNLPLVASADSADGLLDLWTIGPAPKLVHGTRFARLVLTGGDQGDRLLPPARPQRPSSRGAPDRRPARRRSGAATPGPIELSVLPGALRAWLPKPTA
jgi:hypothetical protein